MGATTTPSLSLSHKNRRLLARHHKTAAPVRVAAFWWRFAASVALLFADDNLLLLTTLDSGGFAKQMSMREWTRDCLTWQLPYSISQVDPFKSFHPPAMFRLSHFRCTISLLISLLSFWLDRHIGLWSASIIPNLPFKYLSIQFLSFSFLIPNEFVLKHPCSPLQETVSHICYTFQDV